ncbi:TerB family tellurite resistance protein [Streptomyces sp. NPDC005438]|uniref:TerB family tellurite resistance protein n=1 Tax=Streptomyces sp. NPDC005438 TaxID=3156880 RepID=UPI0033A5647C
MDRLHQRRAGREPRFRLAGVRTSWHTLDDGEFFCPDCGGDRNYRRRTGSRRAVLLGLPLVRRGTTGPVVECADCRHHFDEHALERPTTARLGAMLRDAVHTVALVVLAAGDSTDSSPVAAAVESVRAAGFPQCDEEQLIALLAAFDAESVEGHAVEAELRETLAPLAEELALPGRENLLLRGAHIALADGPYQPAEERALDLIGAALQLPPTEVERLLAAARAVS